MQKSGTVVWRSRKNPSPPWRTIQEIVGDKPRSAIRDFREKQTQTIPKDSLGS
jgi:hypothetical protein